MSSSDTSNWPVSTKRTISSVGWKVAQRDMIGAMFSCSLLAPCWIAVNAVESKMRSIFFCPLSSRSNKLRCGKKYSYTSCNWSCHIACVLNALASRSLISWIEPRCGGKLIGFYLSELWHRAVIWAGWCATASTTGSGSAHSTHTQHGTSGSGTSCATCGFSTSTRYATQQ